MYLGCVVCGMLSLNLQWVTEKVKWTSARVSNNLATCCINWGHMTLLKMVFHNVHANKTTLTWILDLQSESGLW